VYRVVGCSDCSALWVLSGRPDTSGCPRCGTTHSFDRLRTLAEREEEDAARQARAALLADRQGESDAFADVGDFASLETAAAEPAVDDEEYLERSGVDPDAAAAAAERASEGAGGSTSRRETVLAAVREEDRPDEAAVVAYCEARGVPADYVRRALSKLRRAGELTERDGGYELL